MPLPRGHVSLARALSKRGLASRAEAERLIRDGRVHVDGRVVVDPMHAVVPERITVRIDDAPAAPAATRTLLLHKPRGVLTTRRDPEGRRTVYDLLAGVPERVVPVGRLDQATTGLLLLTTDTQLAAWLTDPANAVPRVYLVTVRGRVSPEAAASLEDGRVVDGEPLGAAAVVLRKASGRESHLVVTLTEGRNREVRRLFADIGHEVTRLARVQFGGLALGDLPPGRWRDVTPAELGAAFPAFPRR